FVGTAIADETPAKMGDQRDAVDPFQIRNTAERRAAVRIDHLHLGVVRNVEAPRGRIKRNVIPILLAARRRAEVVFFQEMIAALGPAREGDAAKQKDRAEQGEKAKV